MYLFLDQQLNLFVELLVVLAIWIEPRAVLHRLQLVHHVLNVDCLLLVIHTLDDFNLLRNVPDRVRSRHGVFPISNLERINKALLYLHLRDERAVVVWQTRLQSDFVPRAADGVRVQGHLRRAREGVRLSRKVKLGVFRHSDFILRLNFKEVRATWEQSLPEESDG